MRMSVNDIKIIKVYINLLISLCFSNDIFNFAKK